MLRNTFLLQFHSCQPVVFKSGKSHRSIEKHFMLSHHLLYVIEREEKKDKSEAFHCRFRNMSPWNTYGLTYYIQPSVGSTSDKGPILKEFSNLPSTENMNTEAL